MKTRHGERELTKTRKCPYFSETYRPLSPLSAPCWPSSAGAQRTTGETLFGFFPGRPVLSGLSGAKVR
jgi:hypothetical protein